MSLDLSIFELDSPIKKGNDILIIPSDKLLEGFTSEYFFYNPDTSLSFRTPTNGFTTKNSKLPPKGMVYGERWISRAYTSNAIILFL